MKTIAEVGRKMLDILHHRKFVRDPRYRSGTLSWLIEDEGWLTPVWTFIGFYSSTNDVVRFRNDVGIRLPKAQWPHKIPDQFHFELTGLIRELNDEMLTEVIDYCELARRQPKSKFDRHPPRFPMGADHGGYGWTEKAWELQSRRNNG